MIGNLSIAQHLLENYPTQFLDGVPKEKLRHPIKNCIVPHNRSDHLATGRHMHLCKVRRLRTVCVRVQGCGRMLASLGLIDSVRYSTTVAT